MRTTQIGFRSAGLRHAPSPGRQYQAPTPEWAAGWEAPERSHSRLRAAVTRSSVHNAPTKSKYATSMRSEKLTISMVNPPTAGTHPSKTNEIGRAHV